MYDRIDRLSNGLWQVAKDGNTYLIDNNGKVVSNKDYDEIQNFSKECILVEKDWKYGFVDHTGKEVVSPVYDRIEINGLTASFNSEYDDIRDYYYISSDNGHPYTGGLFKVSIDEKYGLIDRNGKEILPTIYDDVDFIDSEFGCGFWTVEKDEKYGLIDQNGKVILPTIYDDVDVMDVEAGIIIGGRGDDEDVYDIKGNKLTPSKKLLAMVGDGFTCRGYCNGLWLLRDAHRNVGFYNNNGELVSPTYKSFYDIALVDQESGLWVIGNGKDKTVSVKNGKEIASFGGHISISNSYIPGLLIRYNWNNDTRTLIDYSGKEITPVEYDSIEGSPVLANMDCLIVLKDGKLGVINKTGQIITPPIHKAVRLYKSKYLICQNWEADDSFPIVAIDKSGKAISWDIKQDILLDSKHGLVKLRRIVKDGKKGIVDEKSHEVLPCIYDDVFKPGWRPITSVITNVFIVEKDGKLGAIVIE